VSGVYAGQPIFPTTAALRGEDLYVLYAQLGALQEGDFSVAEFPIELVTFSEPSL
jgi:hypothetical protein